MRRVHFGVVSKIMDLQNFLNRFPSENGKIRKLQNLSLTPNPNGDWITKVTYKEQEEKEEEEEG